MNQLKRNGIKNKDCCRTKAKELISKIQNKQEQFELITLKLLNKWIIEIFDLTEDQDMILPDIP